MNPTQLELRRLQALQPLSQADALLENPALLRRFPAEALYSLICSIGLEDALELVQCATPAQFSTLVDLAAWRGGGLQMASLLEWLEAALGEEEAFFAKIQHLDGEVLELIFRRAVHITPLGEEEEEGPEGEGDTESRGGGVMETADGRWRLVFLTAGGGEQVLRRISEIWMARSTLEFSRFLERVCWGLPSELEETAFLFRNARLEDLGFPPREHAVSLLAWLDVRQHLLAPQEPALAELGEDFLEEGFRQLSGEQRLQLEAEARYLVNAFLIAEGAEPGELEAVYDLSRQARDYLNLGLQHVTSGRRSLISAAQQRFGLRKIFQVGLSLTLDLKRSLERLRKEPQAQWQKQWWTMEGLYPVLSALELRRPLLWKEGQKAMFKTLADISFARMQLEKARRQMSVMAVLHGNHPQEALLPFGVELRLLRPERFFCAALAHFVFGEKVLAKPFPPAGLEALEAKLCISDFSALAGAFSKALLLEGALLEEAKEMAMECLHALRAECDALKAKHGRLVPEDMFCVPMETLPP